MDAAASSTRIGDFELLAKLGEGGMGAVYKARMISQDRICALKILPPKAAEDAEYLQRFLREARSTAKLNHPNIVRAYAVGTVEGYHVFAMELVEGTDLKKRTQGLQKLSEDEVVVIGTAIASALAHAHDNGIIHRDVKPENILMDAHGTPKLSDLGLVQVAGDGSLTQTGFAVGTPHYMSPEQSRGDKEVDARADIYALGCTLYFAATGKTPFSGPSPAILMLKHLNEKMPHPQSLVPELSDEFCRVLERMVARKKEDRYQNMHAVHDDLHRLLEGEEPHAEPMPANRTNFGVEGEKTPSSSGSIRKTAVPKVRETRSELEKKDNTDKGEKKRQEPRPWALIGGGIAGAIVILSAIISAFTGGATESKPEKPLTKTNSKATPETKNTPPPVPTPRITPANVPSPPQPAAEPTPVGPSIVPFNAFDLNGWVVQRGEWKVVNGEMVGLGQQGNSAIRCRAKIPGDFEMHFTAKFGARNGWHVIWQPLEGNMVADLVMYDRHTPILGLRKYDGVNEFAVKGKAFSFPDGPVKFRVVQRGADVRLYVNGELWATQQGTAANGAMREFAIYVHGDSEMKFSDFKIREVK
ncbi:MAG TPA: protein kinase [Planctomycetota bacterium]|nr:protein kinase [Planctomycetota bacterium]